MTGRFVPWAGLLDALGEGRLAEVRAALDAAHTDAADRDAFLLAAAVGPVLRDLVPPDAPAEAVSFYGALLHALYLHWAHGELVRRIDRARLRPLLAAPPAAPAPEPLAPYLQLPERMVWAAPAPGAPHEPLDGCFLLAGAARVRVLAVLGARPEREGFTTIEAEAPLPPPPLAARDDGGAPFAPILPAGERMGFVSLTSTAELVWLALLAPLAAAG